MKARYGGAERIVKCIGFKTQPAASGSPHRRALAPEAALYQSLNPL